MSHRRVVPLVPVLALGVLAGVLPAQAPPTLEAVPSVATFAWVAPSRIFSGPEAKSDKKVAHKRYAEPRATAAIPLLANGWREASPDSADFLLAFGEIERTVVTQVQTTRPNNSPANVPVTDQRCDARGNCVPMGQQTLGVEPVMVSVSQTQRMVTMAIVRRRDGAADFFSMEQTTGVDIGKASGQFLAELLLRGRR